MNTDIVNKMVNETGLDKGKTVRFDGQSSESRPSVRNSGIESLIEDSMQPSHIDCFDFLREKFRKSSFVRSLGYIVIDERARINRANNAAAEMIGVRKEQLAQADFFSFIYKKDRAKYFLNRNSLPDLVNRSFDVRLVNGESLFWVRLHFIFDEKLVLCDRQMNLIFQDINSQKHAEKENETLRYKMRQTRKMESIGELSSGIVHDLSNVLQPIIGRLEMLMDDTVTDQKLHQSLQKLLTGAYRAGSLVRQFLSFSHIEDPEICPVKIQPIIREVMELSRKTLPNTVSIIQTIDRCCGPVMASPSHIHQIVLNLLTNSFHAMGSDGGVLEINLEEIKADNKKQCRNLDITAGHYACLSISDTGVGMGADIMDKIYDPFFTTKKKGTGTGLGLSVINRVVKKYGGTVKVSSSPGTGALFKIYLPLVKDTVNSSGGHAVCKSDLEGSESLMFVDDDPLIVDAQKETLLRHGYFVTGCHSGTEALKKFKGAFGLYDMVICDMTMPDITGLELARRVKALSPAIPVIICTGFSEQVNGKNYREMGVDGFLVKPVNKDDCLTLIRHLLDKKLSSEAGMRQLSSK